MRLAIRHRTVYRYQEPVRYTVQSLRLTPSSFAGQTVLDWRVVAPGIERAATFIDGFGNRVHLITIDGPHDSIAITVEGEVETGDTAGIVQGLHEAAPPAVFLRHTPLTEPNAALAALAREAQGESEVARLHDLMRLIRSRVAYCAGTTDAGTTAAEALACGTGVCQDHTHIFIAALRSLDIPARYVSGYLWATEGEPLDGQHAWAEVHVADLGWVGFDVSNGISPDPHYVRVACGLDYASAAPVRGSRRGGSGESLEVDLDVGEAQAQQ